MDHHCNILFKRDYIQLDDKLAQIRVNDLLITVPDHPFWQKFAEGWERDTEQVYRHCVSAGSTVVDIGAWIGPTIVFALACGADNIIALEPNPQSYLACKSMLAANPNIENRITLLNQAINHAPGLLTMGVSDGETDTSMFGIQGNQVSVCATTLRDLLDTHQLAHIDLIKIDIEGAEVLLAEDLTRLGTRPGVNIHLSIHVPFFPPHADVERFTRSLGAFEIDDDRGERLDHRQLRERLVSPEKYPVWGTRHGNFFELLLSTKH